MVTETRVGVEAIPVGLRVSGQIGDGALLVIADHLRLAAERARDELCDSEAAQIDRLITKLRSAATGNGEAR